MRDIREDLAERLQANEQDRAALQKQLAELESRRVAIKAMLADEESRIRAAAAGRSQLPLPLAAALVGGMPMTELIKATLRTAHRALAFEEVKEKVLKTNFEFGDQKPGRVIHGGLLSLYRTGEIFKDENGRYSFPSSNGIPVQEAQLAQ
jgi:hypothetical protein